MKETEEYPLAINAFQLPIFLPLAQLAIQTDKQGQPLPLEEALLPALEERYPIGKELKEWIERSLDSERLVLLLDALDEVIPSKRQQKLCKRLDEFARKHERTQILLTSRLVGYPGPPFPLPREGEFELLPFDRRQQREFVRAWFSGRPDRGELFLRKLRESPQIQALAGIPLLLALMCRLFDERDELPKSRAELYEACIWGILARRWKEWKEERPPRSDESYLDAKLELTEEVALILFCDEKELFSLRDVRSAIKRVFQERPDLEEELGKRAAVLAHELPDLEEEPEKGAAALVHELEGDGLLIKAGAGVNPPYLFLHLTFQEYLAACALTRRKELVALNGGEVPEWLTIMKPHLFDPRWEEVIRLLASKLEDATPLIQAIWQELEDIFLGRLFLAGKCLVDAGRVREGLREEIIQEMLTLMRRALQRRGETPKKQPIPLLDTGSQRESFARLVGMVAGAFSDVLKNLLSMLKEGGSLLIIIRALGRIGSEEAVPKLIELLRDPEHLVRREALEALWAISRKQGIRILLDGSWVKVR